MCEVLRGAVLIDCVGQCGRSQSSCSDGCQAEFSEWSDAEYVWRKTSKFALMQRPTNPSQPGSVGRAVAATRRLWTTLACLLGMTASCAADLLWGVNGHPFNAYPGISIEQQLDYVRDLGMKSYRVNISSADSATKLAELVKAGKERGVQILPVITPELDLDNGTVDDLYAQAYHLASTLVSRFKDDIRVWELGNEMENYAILMPCEMQDSGIQYNCSWGPAGGTETSDYFSPRWAKVSAVLRGLSDATIAVDATIRKAMGTAGWGHRAAFTRMLQDGIRWDISVWHDYGGDPEEAFKFLATLGRPIWLTEFNYAWGQPDGRKSAGGRSGPDDDATAPISISIWIGSCPYLRTARRAVLGAKLRGLYGPRAPEEARRRAMGAERAKAGIRCRKKDHCERQCRLEFVDGREGELAACGPDVGTPRSQHRCISPLFA